jgi:transcriptional regulator with XRE-family HTH domain
MSRPTTVQHPLATLRKAARLGRVQLATRLGMSRAALEKVERGRNPFTALLRERVFAATGVCPGWLATQKGAIHTCDGYPFNEIQLTRWERWREQPPIPAVPEGVIVGIGGRSLGPKYRRSCCPGPDRILAYAPVASAKGDSKTVPQWQKQLELGQRARLVADLLDRVRGACEWSLKHWDQGEAPLWELMAQMEHLFPGVPPVTDIMEASIVSGLSARPPSRKPRSASGRR